MIHGDIHPDFHEVASTLARQLRQSPGGAAACVYHRGEKVVDVWGGRRNEAGEPWERDTTALSFSTTKGVMSTLIHILIDRGQIEVDRAIADYWPEFAEGGKESITVRQLLCHEAGLHEIRPHIDHARRMLDWSHMTEVLAAVAPSYTPGTANGYHGLTYGWLVGELARRVTGKPVPELLEREIAGPLGLDGLYCGVPEDQLHRCADLIQAQTPDAPRRFEIRWGSRAVQQTFKVLRIPVDPVRMADALMPRGIDELDWSSKETVTASIPAANGHFTARSLARMYACLAGGGELDGTRLMSLKTVQEASVVQNRRLDLVIPLPMHWRLGYHRVFTTRGALRGAFGHFGFGGSGAFADPHRELAVAMVLNSGMGTPFGDLRVAQIASAALKGTRRR